MSKHREYTQIIDHIHGKLTKHREWRE